MKFSYKKYGKIIRPVIPVEIIHGSESIRYEVLVDSGADLCIFNSEIADAIGLEWQKGEKHEVFGIGGKASVYYLLPIEIKVGGWPYKIKAGFMPDVSGRVMNYGVVGQVGFFENLIVKFDLIKEEIELKRREY